MSPLDAEEVRVLACLLEKEITTPEYYPLTLNALVNACNQRSNRDPVVVYDEDQVSAALDRLRHRGLSFILTGAGMRVPKFGHRFQEALNLGRRELALLCELMLRGPQTLGELRARAERMHAFSDLEEVEGCLRGLMSRARSRWSRNSRDGRARKSHDLRICCRASRRGPLESVNHRLLLRGLTGRPLWRPRSRT